MRRRCWPNNIVTDSGADENHLATIRNAAGIIVGVTENRTWIEAFFEGDLMHTQTVNLPSGRIFDVYVEAVPHKSTVCEYPRTMIYFDGPCDLEVTRDGDKVIVMGLDRRDSAPSV